jgi:integrase
MKRRQGNITKRGEGRWQLKFDARRENVVRFTRYATVKGTYKDAQAKLRELLNSADDDTLPDPCSQTLAEYLRAWLQSTHTQSPKTIERYGQIAEKQIIPHLGAHKLQKLKPEHVQAWHGALLKEVSARTTSSAHKLLHTVLNYAVWNRTLARNVASVHAAPKVEEQELEVLAPDQISNVLAALAGHTLFPIVALDLATGLRRGEILGLQWGDIDLDAATLRVERSVEETKAGLRLKPPKTKRGRRKISLPSEAVSALRAHKLAQMKMRLTIGLGPIKPDTNVFGDIEGRLRSPHAISRAWRSFCIAKKLPRVKFHSLRHTHASALIRAGVDVLTVSRRLGHSSVAMTLDVYGHLMKGADEAAAAAIDGVLK